MSACPLRSPHPEYPPRVERHTLCPSTAPAAHSPPPASPSPSSSSSPAAAAAAITATRGPFRGLHRTPAESGVHEGAVELDGLVVLHGRIRGYADIETPGQAQHLMSKNSIHNTKLN